MGLNGYEIEGFLRDVNRELLRAQAKFPHPSPNIAAMTEEAGEVPRRFYTSVNANLKIGRQYAMSAYSLRQWRCE